MPGRESLKSVWVPVELTPRLLAFTFDPLVSGQVLAVIVFHWLVLPRQGLSELTRTLSVVPLRADVILRRQPQRDGDIVAGFPNGFPSGAAYAEGEFVTGAHTPILEHIF